MVNSVSMTFTVGEIFLAVREGFVPTSYIATVLEQHGVPIYSVSNELIEVSDGSVEVTELPDDSLHVFWYNKDHKLH